jgi:hypothetical protein
VKRLLGSQTGILANIKYLIRTELRHRVLQLVHLNLIPRMFNWLIPAFAQPFQGKQRLISNLLQIAFFQKDNFLFPGDITIVPHVELSHLPLLLSNPTPATLHLFVSHGYRCSFPWIEMIKDRTQIERCLERAIIQLVNELQEGDDARLRRRAMMTHSTAFLSVTDRLK